MEPEGSMSGALAAARSDHHPELHQALLSFTSVSLSDKWVDGVRPGFQRVRLEKARGSDG